MRVIIVCCCLLAGMAVSCRNPHPGFTRADEGIYYKLLMAGERDRCCVFGDYVTVNVAYATMKDSVFFAGVRKFRVIEPDFPGSIDRCLTMMCRQDSAQFIISQPDFFGKTLRNGLPSYLNIDEEMKISVKLIDIQTAEEYNFEREAFLHWIEGRDAYEKVLLEQYMKETDAGMSLADGGTYYITQKNGRGPAVTVGDTVSIHYEGYFLNGKFFDSTRLRNDPMQFVYGQQWQVISGIEKAIGKMREGEKALVIIPSEQAFGAEGSVQGIVPPFTPVVFEVELISVK